MGGIERRELGEEADRLRRVAPPVPTGVSLEAMAAVHVVTRAVFAATSAAQIVELVSGLVRDLGGGVAPAVMNPDGVVPIDLGLGEVDPLLATAPEVSVARMHLEILLPPLMEDARAAVLRLRNLDRLADEASVDTLTGLLNRRVLFRRLASLTIGDAVLMFDLDHFKRLIDTQGHDAGDAVLAAFGEFLRGSVRSGDIVGRYGGEEFLIGMIGVTARQSATRVAELRERWLATAPPVTFSAGIAAVGKSGARLAVVIADRALYRAKAAGRDRWELAGDDEY